MANLFASLIDEMNDYGYTYNDIDFITTFQFNNGCKAYREVPIEDFVAEAKKVDSQRGGVILAVVMADKSYFDYKYDDFYCEYSWVYYPAIERPDIKIKDFKLS